MKIFLEKLPSRFHLAGEWNFHHLSDIHCVKTAKGRATKKVVGRRTLKLALNQEKRSNCRGGEHSQHQVKTKEILYSTGFSIEFSQTQIPRILIVVNRAFVFGQSNSYAPSHLNMMKRTFETDLWLFQCSFWPGNHRKGSRMTKLKQFWLMKNFFILVPFGSSQVNCKRQVVRNFGGFIFLPKRGWFLVFFM